MSRFRDLTPPWQYLRAFQIDGIAVSQACVKAMAIPTLGGV